MLLTSTKTWIRPKPYRPFNFLSLSNRPALNEPLSDLVLHGLLHVGSFVLADLVLDRDERLLVLLLVHLLRHASRALRLRRLQHVISVC